MGNDWYTLADIQVQLCSSMSTCVCMCVHGHVCVCVCLYVCMCLVLPTSAFFSTLFLVIWFERLSGWTCRGKHFCNSSSGGTHMHAPTHPDETVNIQLQKNDHSARAHTHTRMRAHTPTYCKSVAHLPPLLSAVFRLMNANDLKILIHVCTTPLLWRIWKSSLMDAH